MPQAGSGAGADKVKKPEAAEVIAGESGIRAGLWLMCLHNLFAIPAAVTLKCRR